MAEKKFSWDRVTKSQKNYFAGEDTKLIIASMVGIMGIAPWVGIPVAIGVTVTAMAITASSGGLFELGKQLLGVKSAPAQPTRLRSARPVTRSTTTRPTRSTKLDTNRSSKPTDTPVPESLPAPMTYREKEKVVDAVMARDPQELRETFGGIVAIAGPAKWVTDVRENSDPKTPEGRNNILKAENNLRDGIRTILNHREKHGSSAFGPSNGLMMKTESAVNAMGRKSST